MAVTKEYRRQVLSKCIVLTTARVNHSFDDIVNGEWAVGRDSIETGKGTFTENGVPEPSFSYGPRLVVELAQRQLRCR